MEELVDMAVTFRYLRDLRGPRAGIVGGGGGYSVLASDEIGASGLQMPALPAEIQQKLRDFTPTAGTSVRNPVDTNVGWGSEGLKPILDTIRIVAEAGNIDYILYHTSWGHGPNRGGSDELVAAARKQGVAIGELASEIGKPIVCVARTPTSAPAMEATLAFQDECAAHELPVYGSVAAAALSLSRFVAWQTRRSEFGAAK